MQTASLAVHNLNPEQEKAVFAPMGPVMVVAGPGSGKTGVLTARIAYLIKSGIKPGRILALTFTTKAAEEMRRRVEEMLGLDAAGLWAGTFHSVCLKILRWGAARLGYPQDFLVADEDDALRLFRKAMESVGLEPRDKELTRQLYNLVSVAKNDMLSPDEVENETLAAVYRAYQDLLFKSGFMDFDDLLLNTVRLFRDPMGLARWRKRFKCILVDEFQDTNAAQYEIVRMLAENHGNIFVVLDHDQCIYSWRGARPENMDRFLADFPDTLVLKLEENYRSTKTIVQAVNVLGTRGKKLRTSNPKGEKIVIAQLKNEAEEASFIVDEIVRHLENGHKPQDIAVLVRTHNASLFIQQELARQEIPYRVIGEVSFYSRKEIKDAIAYLRLVLNPNDDAAFTRIVNVPPRGIGGKTVEKLGAYAGSVGLSLYEAAQMIPDSEIGKRARRSLDEFLSLVEDLRQVEYGPELLEAIYERSGYLDMLRREEEWERVENLDHLVRILERHKDEPPADFISFLVTMSEGDVDHGDAVRVMTVHAAKGLEFPIVFVAGLNEGIFPHWLSLQEGREDEERRLMYVAMSRAMRKLYLTCTLLRWERGKYWRKELSRYLKEIPQQLVQKLFLIKR